jgi:hypothetical protein
MPLFKHLVTSFLSKPNRSRDILSAETIGQNVNTKAYSVN